MGRESGELTSLYIRPRRFSIPTSAQTTVRVERLKVRPGRTSLGDNPAENTSTDSRAFSRSAFAGPRDIPTSTETEGATVGRCEAQRWDYYLLDIHVLFVLVFFAPICVSSPSYLHGYGCLLRHSVLHSTSFHLPHTLATHVYD